MIRHQQGGNGMESKRCAQLVADAVERMRQLRLELGLSHETMAAKAGITRPAISHIESGKRKPSLAMAIKLAYALDVELSEILKHAENARGEA